MLDSQLFVYLLSKLGVYPSNIVQLNYFVDLGHILYLDGLGRPNGYYTQSPSASCHKTTQCLYYTSPASPLLPYQFHS